MSQRLVLVGARGYVGAELVRLLGRHPEIEIAAVTSRELAGQPVADHLEGAPAGLAFSEPDVDAVTALDAALWVLALPNGLSAPWVAALDERSAPARVVDLSTDHRFDADWTYGLVERNRAELAGADRIANPGCYATGTQLAIAPLLDLLDGPVHVFGVSGYSGAGSKPSPRNDPERLRDSLMPYALTGHAHEREVRRHLGHPVCFMPHVAPFFRGITLTVSLTLREPLTIETARARYREAWATEPLVRVQDEAPLVRDAVGHHEVHIGGLSVGDDGRRVVVVATLDNLLKGAATQALQNLNLACGLPELDGIAP